MVNPDGVVLNKAQKQQLKKIYKNYTDIFKHHKNDILTTIIKEGAECPTNEDFIRNVDSQHDNISEYVHPFLTWQTSRSRKLLMKDIKDIQGELKQIDEQIDSEETDESISSQKIFNNKQINLNIQNKLIYLIRYKFNLFISIIIIIILICSYLYIIPLLKNSFSN